MIYFANPARIAAGAMRDGILGYIDTPLQGNIRPAGVGWIADNGCYGKGFNEDRWWGWLQKQAHAADSCLFATAPDVVGDAAATLARSTPWLPRIRALGYPAAYVAQDGSDQYPPPWDDFDVLFIGGTTAFKLGAHARQLIGEARRRGKWVHCGRVNSLKRFRAMEALGVDSVDGTFLVFGPSVNLPELLSWVNDVETRPGMFSCASRDAAVPHRPTSPSPPDARPDRGNPTPHTHIHTACRTFPENAQ